MAGHGADIRDPPLPVTAGGHGGPASEVRVLVGRKDLGVGDGQAVRPVRRRRGLGQPERTVGRGPHGHGLREVAELVVRHSRRVGETGGGRFVPGACLVVGVAGAGAEDQVAAGPRVGGEPVERGVVGEIQGGDDEHRVAAGGFLGGRAFAFAARVVELAGVDDTDLASGVEGAAVEGVEDAVVGGGVRFAVRGREGRVLLHQPLARGGVDDGDVGVRFETGDERSHGLELGAQPGEFGVRTTGPSAVREDSAPVGLGAEAQGLPLPVLDHAGAAADEGPGGLAPLAVVGGPVVPGHADGACVGLGDEERFLAGGEHPVGGLVEGPDAGGLPLLFVGVRGGVGQEQAVLHVVVRVAGGDVEAVGEFVVLDCRAGVGDAGRDEVLRAGVLADDVGLPADELGALAGLELPPGDVVLGLDVAVRGPQVGPRRQPVGPIDQAPLAVEGLDVAVLRAQVVGEALEDAVVVEQFQARFVVDLEADDGRVVGVAGDDLADDPLGVEAERRVGEVDFLPGAPADALAGAPLAGDLRVLAGQPRRDGVGGGTEDDGDAAFVGAVQHRLQPVELEAAVLGFPGRPDRLADPDDGEVRLGHEVEVGLELLVGPCVRAVGGVVFVIVGGTEQHAGGQIRHGQTSGE